MSDYIPISEAAWRKGVSVQALYQRVRRGTLKAIHHDPSVQEMDVYWPQVKTEAPRGPKQDRREWF